MYILICYDIQNDRSRNRIGEILLDAGFYRVQKSVFEGVIAASVLREVQRRLKPFVQEKDSIRYYRLCGKCWHNVMVQGVDHRAPPNSNSIVTV
ncbi:MAG: CRISPR-associated endonuclease Cas2 [Calditrichaeota bacterium]|nr:MAG: CRISPR-associated endonuclease Cas2 [Calditrichota bacterium]